MRILFLISLFYSLSFSSLHSTPHKIHPSLSCTTCHSIISEVDIVLRHDLAEKTYGLVLDVACGFFFEFEICYKLYSQFKDIVIHNLEQFYLSPEYICGNVMNVCS
jgi:hypothetical protein